MNLLELIQKRYSVRGYLAKDVEDDKLEYILECARLAPSACNFQPWVFYVVKEEKNREIIQNCYVKSWMQEPPVFIVVCKDSSQSWKRGDEKDFGDVDAAIAAEHICLAAAELGLGTCWICNFNTALLKQGLNIPDHLEALAIFPIGYIDTDRSKVPEKKRKSLEKVTKWI